MVYDREFVRISKSVTPYKNEGKDKNKKCNKRALTRRGNRVVFAAGPIYRHVCNNIIYYNICVY